MTAELLVGTRGGPGSRAAEVVHLVNEIRRGRDLAVLRPDPALARAATVRARHLAAIEVLTHDGWEQALRAVGLGGREAGENIAMGYVAADKVVRGWMASPPHRRNILDASFRFIGVAAAIDDDDDTWWCQLFAGGR